MGVDLYVPKGFGMLTCSLLVLSEGVVVVAAASRNCVIRVVPVNWDLLFPSRRELVLLPAVEKHKYKT